MIPLAHGGELLIAFYVGIGIVVLAIPWVAAFVAHALVCAGEREQPLAAGALTRASLLFAAFDGFGLLLGAAIVFGLNPAASPGSALICLGVLAGASAATLGLRSFFPPPPEEAYHAVLAASLPMLLLCQPLIFLVAGELSVMVPIVGLFVAGVVIVPAVWVGRLAAYLILRNRARSTPGRRPGSGW